MGKESFSRRRFLLNAGKIVGLGVMPVGGVFTGIEARDNSPDAREGEKFLETVMETGVDFDWMDFDLPINVPPDSQERVLAGQIRPEQILSIPPESRVDIGIAERIGSILNKEDGVVKIDGLPEKVFAQDISQFGVILSTDAPPPMPEMLGRLDDNGDIIIIKYEDPAILAGHYLAKEISRVKFLKIMGSFPVIWMLPFYASSSKVTYQNLANTDFSLTLNMDGLGGIDLDLASIFANYGDFLLGAGNRIMYMNNMASGAIDWSRLGMKGMQLSYGNGRIGILKLFRGNQREIEQEARAQIFEVVEKYIEVIKKHFGTPGFEERFNKITLSLHSFFNSYSPVFARVNDSAGFGMSELRAADLGFTTGKSAHMVLVECLSEIERSLQGHQYSTNSDVNNEIELVMRSALQFSNDYILNISGLRQGFEVGLLGTGMDNKVNAFGEKFAFGNGLTSAVVSKNNY